MASRHVMLTVAQEGPSYRSVLTEIAVLEIMPGLGLEMVEGVPSPRLGDHQMHLLVEMREPETRDLLPVRQMHLLVGEERPPLGRRLPLKEALLSLTFFLGRLRGLGALRVWGQMETFDRVHRECRAERAPIPWGLTEIMELGTLLTLCGLDKNDYRNTERYQDAMEEAVTQSRVLAIACGRVARAVSLP